MEDKKACPLLSNIIKIVVCKAFGFDLDLISGLNCLKFRKFFNRIEYNDKIHYNNLVK